MISSKLHGMYWITRHPLAKVFSFHLQTGLVSSLHHQITPKDWSVLDTSASVAFPWQWRQQLAMTSLLDQSLVKSGLYCKKDIIKCHTQTKKQKNRHLITNIRLNSQQQQKVWIVDYSIYIIMYIYMCFLWVCIFALSQQTKKYI